MNNIILLFIALNLLLNRNIILEYICKFDSFTNICCSIDNLDIFTNISYDIYKYILLIIINHCLLILTSILLIGINAILNIPLDISLLIILTILTNIYKYYFVVIQWLVTIIISGILLIIYDNHPLKNIVNDSILTPAITIIGIFYAIRYKNIKKLWSGSILNFAIVVILSILIMSIFAYIY